MHLRVGIVCDVYLRVKLVHTAMPRSLVYINITTSSNIRLVL